MDFDGETVVTRTMREVSNSGFSELIAVTGFQSDLVAKEILKIAAVKTVFNANSSSGMHSSIRVGLQALEFESDFFSVALADQPLLRSSDYNFLISEAERFPTAKLIAPRYRGVRGNPVFISTELRLEVLAHADSDRGCAYLFERYPHEIVDIEMPESAVEIDVDTPQLLKSAKQFADQLAEQVAKEVNDATN